MTVAAVKMCYRMLEPKIINCGKYQDFPKDKFREIKMMRDVTH